MRLCFGSYMTVLKLCKANKSVTQKMLCGTALLSVSPLYDIRTDDVVVNALLKCRNNLSEDVTDVAPTADECKVVIISKSTFCQCSTVIKSKAAYSHLWT